VRLEKGVDGDPINTSAIDRFLAEANLEETLSELRLCADRTTGPRREYLLGICLVLDVVWSLAMEKLNRGDSVCYSTCVMAAIGQAPKPSNPEQLILRLREALVQSGHSKIDLQSAIEEWRQERLLTARRMPSLFIEIISRLDGQSRQHLLQYLPQELREIPWANCDLRPIPEAYFSGCLKYVVRRGRQGER
jgi:hypothetical protein